MPTHLNMHSLPRKVAVDLGVSFTRPVRALVTEIDGFIRTVESADRRFAGFTDALASANRDDSHHYNSKTRTGKAGTWPAPKQKRKGR